jgi:GT2 family glycosyltransferase
MSPRASITRQVLSVTAVVPTCHRTGPLLRALRSIGAQTVAPTQIIVVDDAGGRDADAVRHAVLGSGVQATVVTNSGAKGPSGARNTGARISGTDLLAFLDDDDEWLPAYLASALEHFESQALDVICTDLVYRHDDGTERLGKRAPDRLATELFLTRNPGLIGSNLIVRRSLFQDVGGFDESIPVAEDMDFGIRLSRHGTVRYQPLRERLVRHYQHGGPRLCTPRTAPVCAGIRRFYELHAPHMTEAQRAEFRSTVGRLWGIDERGNLIPAPEPPPAP